MFLKCIKPWKAYRPGDIWDHPRGAAQLLIKRGMAEATTVSGHAALTSEESRKMESRPTTTSKRKRKR